MFEIILEIILVIIPFLLVFTFQNKTIAFVWIFSGLTLFYLILSMVTQSLGIFTYDVIFYSSFIVAIGSALFIIKRKFTGEISIPKISTVLIFLIIIFNLTSVHYLYTGKMTRATGVQEVKNSFNKYPYFSDEWNAISIAKNSIENKSFPNTNPLRENKKFPNPMFPYFSFISGIFLLTNTNPLIYFVPLSIFFSFLISLFIFIALKQFGVSRLASTLVILSLPYITVGSNLPGMWHLLPMTLGILFLILSLISIQENRKYLLFLNILLSLLFYPPMIVFVIPCLLGYYFFKREKIEKKDIIFFSSLTIIGLLAFFIVSANMNRGYLKNFFKLIFRDNLEPGIPLFEIYNVLPFWILILSVIGFWAIIKKRMSFLVYPIIVGLIYWIIYTQTRLVFLIDYPRIVVITSILLAIISAFGLDFILQKFNKKNNWNKKENLIVYLLIFIFAISSISYTQREKWQKLVMVIKYNNNQSKQHPNPPANQYLLKEDLEIFSGIKNKVFIAPQWKGLVIGSSTGNFPLESKAGTITNRIYRYDEFMKLDCQEKNEVAEKHKINFVYSQKFVCKEFIAQKESSEGLVLYKYGK